MPARWPANKFLNLNIMNNVRIIICAAVLCSTSNAIAQQTSEIKDCQINGFYLTAKDFASHHPSYPIDNKHKGDQIKLRQFFFTPDIVVYEQNDKARFYKDSIFSIQMDNNENYRFINRRLFLIADTLYLYIYINKMVTTIGQLLSPRRTQQQLAETQCYFSTGNHAEVYLLTVNNLRKYVLMGSNLHQSVCEAFITDEQIQSKDEQSGHFLINNFIVNRLRR
jgi:hypothetical protein